MVGTFALVSLLGLVVGLWREGTFPDLSEIPAAPLPTTRSLAMAWAVFALLIYPLILLVRGERAVRVGPGWQLAGETGLCAVVAHVL